MHVVYNFVFKNTSEPFFVFKINTLYKITNCFRVVPIWTNTKLLIQPPTVRPLYHFQVFPYYINNSVLSPKY